MYIHETKTWPDLTWDADKIVDLLAEIRHLQGRLLGRMEALGFQLREEASFQVLTQDVLKTSEIEGERFDTEQVRSSLAKHLGLNIGSSLPKDRNVEGIVEITLDATCNYDLPLTKERLFNWHAKLFPQPLNSLRNIKVGDWRDAASGPMQVVSGPYGRETVHYEAPSYERLESKMIRFIDWFNAQTEMDLVIKSAIAHFWFVTIHPFDDGNGRIARAIADISLARSEKTQQRFYSMSAQISQERNAYYDVLEKCQKGDTDITLWIEWFLQCLKRAITASEEILQTVLTRARFWEAHVQVTFNERQRAVINRLLDKFEGKLTSSKWAKLTKCSQDTALRDINELLQHDILIKDTAGGRSTSYQLNLMMQTQNK